MTIKELEERTGLARANIRFYESEGLIAPKRLDNGYRDYSEEDVVTLEKIKLLRELHLDIETIRLVQRGELKLEQALFSHLNRLEGDKAAIDRAVEVCRELERSGVGYAALEPKPWLGKLEVQQYPRRIEEPAKPVPPKPWWDGLDRAYHHPWMRYFARSVDIGIYLLVIYLVSFLCFRTQALLNMGTLLNWLFNTAMLGVMLLLEPFWLHYVGWTPGKWIFGLKLRNERGEKLTLEEGFRRVGGVFVTGYGLGIPVYSLWRNWKGYKCCGEGQDCSWDGEEGFVYLREERKWCGLVYVLCEAAYFGVLVLGLAFTYAPLHTGELTTAEYCENVNHVLKVYLNSDERLDARGNWIEPAGYVIDLGGTDGPEFLIEEENGVVKSVTLTETGSGNFIYQSTGLYQAAVIAMEGAVEGGWPLNHDDIAGELAEQWNGFAIETDRLRVVQEVEHSGYDGIGQVLVAIEGKEQSYTKTVTITLIGSDGT